MDTHTGSINHDHVTVVCIYHCVHNSVPHAGLGPTVETIVDRRVRTITPRKIAPWCAGAQNIENAIEHTAVVNTRNATRFVWQNTLYELPLQLREIKSSHHIDPKCSRFNEIESQTLGKEQDFVGTLPNAFT